MYWVEGFCSIHNIHTKRYQESSAQHRTYTWNATRRLLLSTQRTHETLPGGFCSIHNVHMKHYQEASAQYTAYAWNTNRTLPIFGFRGGPCTIANRLLKFVVTPARGYIEFEDVISAVVLKFWHFTSGFFCVSIEILILCMCVTGAYNGPFRKHNFNLCEDSLMMAHMEGRNM